MDELLNTLVEQYGELEPGLPVPDLLGVADELGLDFHGYASMARLQVAFLTYYEDLQRAGAGRPADPARAEACACRCRDRAPTEGRT